MKQYSLVFLFLLTTSLLAQKDLFVKAENHIYSNKDSCYYYTDLLFKKSVKEKNYLLGVKGLLNGAESSNHFNDYSKMRYFMDQADMLFEELIDSLDYEPDGVTAYRQLARYYNGLYHYKLNDYKKATPHFLKILETVAQLPDSIAIAHYKDFITTSNSYLALFYQLEYKYEVALEFYRENLRLHEKLKDDHTLVYQTKNLIASLHSDQGDYASSNRLAKDAIAYYIKSGPDNNPNSLNSVAVLLINNYIKTKRADSATYYYQKLKPYSNYSNQFKNEFLSAAAQINMLNDEYAQAVIQFRKIIQNLESTVVSGDRLAEVYRDLGSAYQHYGELEKATLAYETSLSFFNLDSTNRTRLKTTPASNIDNLLSTLKKQVSLFNRIEDFEQTLETGSFASEKLNEFKRTFYNDRDKQNLVNNILPIFEASIEAAYQLHLQTKDPKYVTLAFEYVELSKSPILLDALYRNNASSFKGVPESELENERILKQEISALEEQLTKGSNQEKEQRLFTLKRQRDELIQNIEKEYPAYYDLKYSGAPITLSQFQSEIPDDLLVLSYFYGSEALYALTIDKQHTRLHKLSPSVEGPANIKKFNSLLATPTSDLCEITEISHNLYETYVTSPLAPYSQKRLLIMPDGLLHTFPFEALSTDGTIGNLLIHTYQTSYVSSASLWSRLQTNYETNDSFVGFAPSFENNLQDEEQFAVLPNNEKEIENITKYFDGTLYTSDQATLANFKRELTHHNIIHLATHAVANDQVPEYSFLAFAKANTDQESFLYVNDLYLEAIKANLVTLSACETGVGTLEKGEGVMSLSRAFFYSGAKSMLYTLWNINDYSSSMITETFYKELSLGAHKDEALQQAKLAFLEKNKDTKLSHPYYWSSFIINGNTLPIAEENKIPWYWMIPAILLILIVIRKPLLKRFK